MRTCKCGECRPEAFWKNQRWCKVCSRKHSREWRAANRSRVLVGKAAWRAANREKINARNAVYRKSVTAKTKVYMLDYYRRNKDRFKANGTRWIAKNPEKVAAMRHNRRAAGAEHMSDVVVASIHTRYGGFCVYCGGPGTHIDHFIPIARGGTNAEGNLVEACKSCNSSKGSKEPFAWMMSKGVKFDVRAAPCV